MKGDSSPCNHSLAYRGFVFREIVRGWINESPVKNDRVEMMLQALLEDDILLRPRDLRPRGYIMELKVCESDYGDTVEETLDSALAQIEKKQYEATLRQAGVTDILKMTITFDGKRVWMKKQYHTEYYFQKHLSLYHKE